ncbi:hypothetical protein CSPX01_09054 [Colletotrichum filicis]|nr:hypothetical protein CSPX01_09054 [Colletotrichum filicis]
METASSKCQENQNSTDCLLQALLIVLAEQKQAQDAGIDWDPITFGVTLLIGLVASTIALATVFQAVIAGGKGGRRANSRAIGRWSKYTTRKWIFSEMSWSYTAYTPVLGLSSLEGHIKNMIREKEDEEYEEWERRVETSKSESKIRPSSNLIQRLKEVLKLSITNVDTRVGPYPATWLGLFKITGLENFDKFDLTPITADYLPDDFIAVPASAEVGAITVLTAAAGVHRLDVDTGLYPVIIGHGFQFDFRQHPVLGVVGAFSEHLHLRDRKNIMKPSLEKISEAVMHSHGEVELRVSASYNTDPTVTQVAAPPRDTIGTRETKGHSVLRQVLLNDIWLPRDQDSFRPYYESRNPHLVPIASFLLAKSPKSPPSLFPVSAWKHHNPFSIIALNGTFWPTAELHGFFEQNWEQWDAMSLDGDRNYEALKFLDTPDRASEETVYETGFRVRNKRSLPSQGASTIPLICLGLLYHPKKLQEKMSKFSFLEKQKLREAVHDRLRQADWWLADVLAMEKAIEHRIRLLFATSLALSRAEDMTHEGLLKVPNTSEIVEEGHEQQKQSPSTVQGMHCKMLQALGNLTEGFKLDHQSLKATLKTGPTLQRWEHGELGPIRRHLRKEFFGSSLTQAELQITPADQEYLDHFERKIEESKSQIEGLAGPGNHSPETFFNTHQMLSRLATVVGCHTRSNNADRKNDALKRKIDDVIIYRSLLIGVLFYTALDHSKVLESGVWDRVVPVI